MLWWLETQQTPVIVLVVFAFCYLLAALILIALAVLSRGPIASALPGANVDHAQTYVAQEASGIRQAMLISSVLPPDTRDAVRGEIGTYLRFVDEVDWPATLRGQERLRRSPPGLPDALITLLSFVPQQPGQQLAQSRAVAAIEQVLQARRDRILLSEAAISPPQGVVIVVLDALILLTIGTVHAGRHMTTAASMLIFSTAVAARMADTLKKNRMALAVSRQSA
jgi:hypothetical protein